MGPDESSRLEAVAWEYVGKIGSSWPCGEDATAEHTSLRWAKGKRIVVVQRQLLESS